MERGQLFNSLFSIKLKKINSHWYDLNHFLLCISIIEFFILLHQIKQQMNHEKKLYFFSLKTGCLRQ